MPEFNLDALLKQITAAQEKANKANIERYGELLVHLDGLAKQIGVEGTYGTAMKQLETLGTAGRTRIAEQATKAQAATEQDLMTRGLASTTIRTAARGAISRDAERARQELEERVSTSKAGLLTQRAGAELQIGGMRAGVMERRADVGPDMALYASLIKAATAADTTATKRTARIIGGSMFPPWLGAAGGAPSAGGLGGLSMGAAGGAPTRPAAPTGGALRQPDTGTARGLIDPQTGRMTGLVQPGGLAEAGGAPIPQAEPAGPEQGAGISAEEVMGLTGQQMEQWTGMEGIGGETPTAPGAGGTRTDKRGFTYEYNETDKRWILRGGADIVARTGISRASALVPKW